MYKRPLSAQSNPYRINILNKNKKYENISYTNNKDLLAYWEKKKIKSNEKLEKIKQELYNKENGEIRNTPIISSNSKKIINRILKNNENNYLNSFSNQSAISMRNFLNYKKFCFTDNNTGFFNKYNNYNIKQNNVKKEKNIIIKKIQNNPVIKKENIKNTLGYQKSTHIKIINNREKKNHKFNNKSKEKNHQHNHDNNYFFFKRNFSNPYIISYTYNNTNKIHSLLQNNSVNQKVNSNNDKMKQEEINFSKDNQEKNVKNNIKLNFNNSKNQNKSQSKINENRKNDNSYFRNKPIEVPEMEILKNVNFKKNYINKNQNLFPKSNSSITINKRNDDLNKFILFANNLYIPKNKNKGKNKK